jgi:hypothetical protein
MSITIALIGIERWLRAHTPATAATLGPAATPDRLDGAASAFGRPLPADVQRLYLWHGGTTAAVRPLRHLPVPLLSSAGRRCRRLDRPQRLRGRAARRRPRLPALATPLVPDRVRRQRRLRRGGDSRSTPWAPGRQVRGERRRAGAGLAVTRRLGRRPHAGPHHRHPLRRPLATGAGRPGPAVELRR